MNEAYILTGGNLNDRVTNLSCARELISESCGAIIKASSIYQTAAWGNENQPDFLNQVLCIHTERPALSLLSALLEIEAEMGRVRNQKNDPRIIDLDILYFNDQVLAIPDLELPHPRLHLRRFVLVPLCEISPNLLHPILQKDTKWLLDHCPDPLNVKKFSL